MLALRLLTQLFLGRRLPHTEGEIAVPGLAERVTIRRDRWGIPAIEAPTEVAGWFGLGFCHAQDRAFQLETLVRLSRGTLAELVGPEGVALDRLSRRIGFREAGRRQLVAQSEEGRAILGAYAAGINAGYAHGADYHAHEFTILGDNPTPWQADDILGILALQSFLLPSNWDAELARLRILIADGPEALKALDPADLNRAPLPIGAERWNATLSQLQSDLSKLQQVRPLGGGSNNWVISGSRTLSGKPLLANDPHLPPGVPPPWYLASIRTPNWAVAGATLVGGPAFPTGHNGQACWGVTAGLTDMTDLFLEPLGPDGTIPGETRHTERIVVKGKPDVLEEVVRTPRGPIITPLIPDVPYAISIRGVWLDGLPIQGLMVSHRHGDFDSFRRTFAAWPALPQNLVYADAGGTIGYQLIGQVPRREPGEGLLPTVVRDAGPGWEKGLVPFDEMPSYRDPEAGYIATANAAVPGEQFLGADFCDPYRFRSIDAELSRTPVGWTVADCLRLQMDQSAHAWTTLKPIITGVVAENPDAAQGLELLRSWDGQVAADSPAATIYELLLAELICRIARAKAPRSWEIAIGGGGMGPFPANLFSARRVAHLVTLLTEQPAGWFDQPWSTVIHDTLTEVVRNLRKKHGPGPDWWQWGDLRPLTISHAILGKHWLLKRLFNLPTIPCGGDANTVNQASTRPLEPLASPGMIPNYRGVYDTADWSNSRFVLAGGQSGNPFSPHYDDLFALWQTGQGVPIAFTREEVLRSAVATLHLLPGGG